MAKNGPNVRVGIINLDILPELLDSKNKKTDKYKIINGFNVKISSQRYPVFQRSLECPTCHCVASYFAIERPVFPENARYHLNLYGLDKKGNEVLFTKDHILAKANGGKNIQSNYRTMCAVCNLKKGSKIE